MHVNITDPDSGKTVGSICIERDTRTCYILQSQVEYLDVLVGIARAQKVPEVRLVTPSAAMDELMSLGWKPSSDLIVMIKGPKDG